MSTPERIFIGWDKPLAEAVAAKILEAAKAAARGKGTRMDESAEVIDLGDQIVLAPSAFAGRLIQEELAKQHEPGVLLPRIESPDRFLNWGESDQIAAARTRAGRRPGEAAPADLTVAGSVETRAAWLAVFAKADQSDFPALLPEAKPGPFSFSQANTLARKLTQLRNELGGSEMGYDLTGLASLKDNHEPLRWADLAKLEDSYRKELDLRRWVDHNDLRVELALGKGTPEGVRRIVVAALPDPQPLLVAALRRLAGEGIAITVMIGADASDAPLFDDWGRPLQAAWKERRSDWPEFDRRVHVVADPAGGLSCMRRLVGGRKPVEGTLAICACDREQDSGRLASLMHSLGADATNPLGKAHAEHVLHHALRAWASCLGATEPNFAQIRAVLHIPSLVRGLAGGKAAGSYEQVNQWLDAADESMLRGGLAGLIEQSKDYPLGEETHERIRAESIRKLAAPLEALQSVRDRQLKAAPREALLESLATLASELILDLSTEDGTFAADVLDELEDAAERLQASTTGMDVSHPEFFELVLEMTGISRFRWSEGGTSINLPGWVEAGWDPVPHLVIFGLNDHLVPRVRHADPFLPAKMREQAKLAGNDEVFAAAAFSLERMRRQRANRGRLDVVVPQASEEGDPLRPSRLLFLAPDDQLTSRVRRLFADAASEEPEPFWEVLEQHKLDPAARPERADKIAEELSASKIKDYLADPAEFWLKRALGMDGVEHGRAELNAAAFGTLTHGALQRYGEEEIAAGKAFEQAHEVEVALLRHLAEQLKATFGSNPSPAVLLQAAAAKARLCAFARTQSNLAKEGWRIVGVEKNLPPLKINGSLIIGRYDRLDRNERTGAWRVFDYKTKADADNPRDTHLRMPRTGETEFLITVPGKPKKDGNASAPQTRRWVDLQLPIYHAALRGGEKSIGESPLEIGYLCLPALASQTGPQFWQGFDTIANLSHQSLAKVVEKIRTGGPAAFAPAPRRPKYPLLPDLAARPTEGWMLTNRLGGKIS